ncbi:hypothetical protein [Erythrobacter rubeus]|uniref:Uncharacterized protein n=1 Tax=Erythrobacter rubeus TaxID=2760803 RepID=A0ABR8KW91_9SPHN|nr:hypothetical protein [Erythrobacter rubeus]MBD2842689.1 hypothetical protein [Erythrobacter rubeus]
MPDSVRHSIALRLADGPVWMRSFQAVKPIVDAMVADDELGRAKPESGVGWNMIALTRRGADRYGVDCKRVVRSNSELLDELAEHIANGRGVVPAAKLTGIPETHALAIWRAHCGRIGEQAT